MSASLAPFNSPTLGMDCAIDRLPRQRSSLNHARIAGRTNTKPEGSSGLLSGRWEGQDDVQEIGDTKHSAFSSDEEPRPGSSSQSTSEDVELDHIGLGDKLSDDEETGLTQGDRHKRSRRKRRHTLMDERVTVGAGVEKQERILAEKSIVTRLLVNAVLIGLWYTFSLSISIYNTWMFSSKHLDFHFPLFTTCIHMLVQFSLASLVLYLFPRFRPRADSISNPHDLGQSSLKTTQADKPLMTRTFYLTRIGPCGAATGLDIGLGNMSLKFITLTFFTMCKSSALAFVLIFAFLFRLETPSIKLILIIATMTIGVIMMVAGEAAFNALGFILIISSAFFSGFRWALTQILLLRNPATSNPFSSIFFLAPVMFLSLLLIALPIEGPRAIVAGIHVLTEEKGVLLGFALLLFPGVLAFLMTSSEFALLQRTSVVTLSICGIFKEVVTISAAGIVFHDPLTPINISGLLVTIASIGSYNYMKITKMRREARNRAQKAVGGEGESAPMLAGGERDEETNVPVQSGLDQTLRVGRKGLGIGSTGRGSQGKRTEDFE